MCNCSRPEALACTHPDVRSDETCGRDTSFVVAVEVQAKEPGGLGLGRDADMHGMRSCTYHSSLFAFSFAFAFSFSIIVFDCKSAIVQEGYAGSPDQFITAVSQ